MRHRFLCILIAASTITGCTRSSIHSDRSQTPFENGRRIEKSHVIRSFKRPFIYSRSDVIWHSNADGNSTFSGSVIAKMVGRFLNDRAQLPNRIEVGDAQFKDAREVASRNPASQEDAIGLYDRTVGIYSVDPLGIIAIDKGVRTHFLNEHASVRSWYDPPKEQHSAWVGLVGGLVCGPSYPVADEATLYFLSRYGKLEGTVTLTGIADAAPGATVWQDDLYRLVRGPDALVFMPR